MKTKAYYAVELFWDNRWMESMSCDRAYRTRKLARKAVHRDGAVGKLYRIVKVAAPVIGKPFRSVRP